MDVEEAKRLIREGGYRPYIRKSKGRKYITLKRGSRELSVGPYSEELWQALNSEWTIAVYGKPSRVEEAKPRLTGGDAQKVFKLLSKGYDPAQVVEATGLDPDTVMLASKRYMELKGMPLGGVERQIGELRQWIEELDKTTARFMNFLLDAMNARRSLCFFFRDGRCRLPWSREILRRVEMESIHVKLFEAAGEAGDGRVFITPSPLMCLICPYHGPPPEQEARR